MIRPVLNEFVTLVDEDIHSENEHLKELKLDPAWLEFLKQIAAILLPMLGGCVMSPKLAARRVLAGGVLGRFYKNRCNKVVREEIDEFDLEDELLEPVVNSFVKVAAGISDKQNMALMASVG